jgi:hypothetical protein
LELGHIRQVVSKYMFGKYWIHRKGKLKSHVASYYLINVVTKARLTDLYLYRVCQKVYIVPGKNNWPATNHWQTLTNKVV